jgi:hypothetical protein
MWDGVLDGTNTASADTKWTTATNWVGDVAPVAGDILEFPNTATVQSATNDLPASTQFDAIRFVFVSPGASSYAIDGNSVVVTGDISAALINNVLSMPVVLGADVLIDVSGALTFDAALTTAGHTATIVGGGVVGMMAGATGAGGIVLGADAGILDIRGTSTFTGGTVLEGGQLMNQGTLAGPVLLDGGTIETVGHVNGDVTSQAGGGVLDLPGSHFPIIDGNFTLNDATSFQGKDSLTVNGAVALNDASYDVGTAWCSPSCSYNGLHHTWIYNDGTDPVAGTFAGLPNGARFEDGGYFFEISYTEGDGNDVGVRVVTSLEPDPPPPPPRSGYWMLRSDGGVYKFGDAHWYGEPIAAIQPGEQAVDIEPAADFNGYLVLTNRCRVFAFGSAPSPSNFSSPSLRNGETCTSLSVTPTGGGYWMFSNQGRAFTQGDAVHRGDMGSVALNGPVLGSVATPSGKGYYMVASDGGIFAFGDAEFRGSMGGHHLNGPVVGLAPDPDNVGYWLVASDGGIFAFDATFRGSMGSQRLNKPVIGMVGYGDGYLMVASDGGIFSFSFKPFAGSLGSNPPPVPIVAVGALNE